MELGTDAYGSKLVAFEVDTSEIFDALRTAHIWAWVKAVVVVALKVVEKDMVYLAHPKAGVNDPNA